jgi:peptidylprolyl isomerase
MKLTAAFLFTTMVLAQNATAQTPAKPAAPQKTASTGAPAPGKSGVAIQQCIKLPELSPKIPALPAGETCAKPLYTLTTVPNVKLGYVSPLEGSVLKETLGIEPSTFTLAYIDTRTGTGALAQPHKWYTMHYTGYLVDGSKFDSSYDHADKEPFTFQAGEHQVVAGWDTGFAGMRVGGKRRLFIPYQLAYGPNGRPPTIPAKAELIFDVEFISQSNEKPAPKTPPTPPAAANPTRPGVPGTSGMGSGAATPATSTPPSAAPAGTPPPANPPKPQ